MKVYFTKYSGKIKFKKTDAIDILTKRYIIRIRGGGLRITKKKGKLIYDKYLNLKD